MMKRNKIVAGVPPVEIIVSRSELLFDQWLTIEEIEENFWDICRERYISREDILS